MSETKTGWTDVLYFTLTAPSWSDLPKMLDEASRWLCDVRNVTKSHLHPVTGYEDGSNLHIHGKLAVPNDELEYFKGRRHKIKKSRFYKYVADVQDFKPELADKCLSYIVDKHIQIHMENITVLCPGRYARCRKGKCGHLVK